MAILFDLDGTLVDSAADVIYAINCLSRELGKPLVDPQLLKDNTSFGLNRLFQLALDLNLESIDPSELNALKARFGDFYKKSNFVNSKLFPGIQDLIDNLCQNKVKIGVVTNKSLEFSKIVLEKVGLIERFNCLIAADSVKNIKPSPEPVLLAMKQLHVSPKDCLFIGDAEQDVIAGNAAGVRTVAALYGYVGAIEAAKCWPANYFVNDSTEIWPLVCSLYKLN
jgi:N-acetyl-D-muramate 6-phosphate phosphatase